jgi:phage anti-repressor protein
MEIVKIDSKLYTSANEVYIDLGIKKKFATWIKTSIERVGLEENKDFVFFREQSTGGRPLDNYLLTRDSALTIIVMSGGKFAKDLRKKVIDLYNSHDKGLSFTAPNSRHLWI